MERKKNAAPAAFVHAFGCRVVPGVRMPFYPLCIFVVFKSCSRPTVGLDFRVIRSRTAIADRHGMNHPARPRPVDPSRPASKSDGPPPAAVTCPSCPS
ncbi:hypothetical protein BDP81DRAFT_70082 [Colletotrichum phormii]|uniref:Uncharacterized protein n=1 Tax=Colletotrichum phormii TaxID=359342 RepID=A0AAI9ZKP9_9PEZI|nr:uncharacterized protein BDP81DRAFT_70082 [Colletotrichum phormii]KAK1633709.1 hypothetical protein BDP81DRAFT_70082 [Colletotrichum phormii]